MLLVLPAQSYVLELGSLGLQFVHASWLLQSHLRAFLVQVLLLLLLGEGSVGAGQGWALGWCASAWWE